jgi:aspartate aminotransferase
MKLAKRLEGVKPSATLAITARARALAAKGIDVVGFGAGEPDFDTPRLIKDAAKRALDEGYTKYTPSAGFVELREAIANRIREDHRVTYQANEILVSCGGKHALYNLFQALLDPGDEVIVFTPYWVSYADMVRVAGGVPILVETTMDEGFDPSPEAIRRAFGPRTRAVILNSPSNPTGAMLSRRTLETVIGEAKGKDVLIVTDDIYDQLVYRGTFENVLDLDPSLQGQVALVNGASKTFAMTGWRIGWTAGPPALIAAMGKLQDNSTSNPNSIAQRAVLAALTLPEVKGEVEEMRKVFDERRRHVVARLNAIPGVRCFDPAGAFYAFPDVKGLLERTAPGASEPIGTDEKLIDLLLEKYLVAAVPGSAFGAPGHIRISFATSREQIDKGLDRLEKLAHDLGL